MIAKLSDMGKDIETYKSEVLEWIYHSKLETIRMNYTNKVYDSFDFLVTILSSINDIKIYQDILPINIDDWQSLEILIKGLGFSYDINTKVRFKFLNQFINHENTCIKDVLITALGELLYDTKISEKIKSEIKIILTKFTTDKLECIRESAEDALMYFD